MNKKLTDNEIIKALECCNGSFDRCGECPLDNVSQEKLRCWELEKSALNLINRLQAENERLKGEVSNARRKALLEAKGKFAGHSDYHGDTILCKLICMAEGKEVGSAKPLDKSEIKSEAYKEFANRIEKEVLISGTVEIHNLLKEMVGDKDERNSKG